MISDYWLFNANDLSCSIMYDQYRNGKFANNNRLHPILTNCII